VSVSEGFYKVSMRVREAWFGEGSETPGSAVADRFRKLLSGMGLEAEGYGVPSRYGMGRVRRGVGRGKATAMKRGLVNYRITPSITTNGDYLAESEELFTVDQDADGEMVHIVVGNPKL
jgi:hypothetical protein